MKRLLNPRLDLFKQNVNFFMTTKDGKSKSSIGSPCGTLMTIVMLIVCSAYFGHECKEMFNGSKDRYDTQQMHNGEKYVLQIENFLPFIEIMYNAENDEIPKVLDKSIDQIPELRYPLFLDYEILSQYFSVVIKVRDRGENHNKFIKNNLRKCKP